MKMQHSEHTNLVDVVEQNYTPKKRNAMKIASYAVDLGFITLERAFAVHKSQKVLPVEKCGNYLNFATTELQDKSFLYDARFCNWRFCSMCERRKSLHRGFALSCIMRRLVSEKKRFIFMTLTVPNVKGEELRDTLTQLSKSWDRMSRRAKYKKTIIGSVRKTEVTYNRKTKTYHPHLHVFICVDESYFKIKWIKENGKTKRTYPNLISHDELLQDWRQATRNEEITQVDIRTLKNNNLDKSVREVSKYTSKDSDLVTSKEAFKWFYKGLKGKKLFTCSGLVDDYFKLFKKDKQQFKDFYDERVAVEWEYLSQFNWQFKKKDYTNYVRKLTDEEKQKINQKWLGATVELEENKDY